MAVIEKRIGAKSKVSQKIYAQLDEAWKEALQKYFKDFIALCWPEVFDKIDWDQGYEFLEQEFQKILHPSEIRKKITDKLVKVKLKDKQEIWILIHLEVQSAYEKDFAERMFIYRYRIFDKYHMKIATFVILADVSHQWRPSIYEREFWGSKLKFEYPILKIIDFKDKKETLEASKNPFAVVILAQLAALATANNDEARLVSKFNLTKRLFNHGFLKSEVIDLLRFMEEILVLSKEHTLEYHQQVKKLEEELKVSFITMSERMWLEQGEQKGVQLGIEQGMQQGMQQGIQRGLQRGEMTMLMHLLKYKFSIIPEKYAKCIEGADEEQLLAWCAKALDSTVIDDVFVV